MTLNHKTIFLLDATGAVVSALFLGLVLPKIQSYIGLPVAILYLLSGLAVLLALTSFGCFALADHHNPRWLSLISNLNLAYCLLTAGLVWVFRKQMGVLGVIYFVAEILIVLALVRVEKSIAKDLSSPLGEPRH